MNRLGRKAVAAASALIIALFSVAFPASAAKVSVLKTCIVNVEALNFRKSPSLSANVLGVLKKDDAYVVTEIDGDWATTMVNGTKGYLFKDYISLLDDYSKPLGTGSVTGSTVNLRSGPDTSTSVITKLNRGDSVTVDGMADGWYKITIGSYTGYIHPDYLEMKTSPSAPSGVSVASRSEPNKSPDLIDYAMSYLGVRYVYGGTTPKGFDCSGFTMYVYKNFGVTLPHSSSAQSKLGTYVAKSELQPGDLVFFSGTSYSSSRVGHVGIYIGNGKFVHSSSPGDVVKVTALSSSYYASRYITARRVTSDA